MPKIKAKTRRVGFGLVTNAVVGLALVGTIFVGCVEKKVNVESITFDAKSIQENISALKSARIYFGHQSVGFNVLDGLADLIKEADVDSFSLRVWQNGEPAGKPGLIHSAIGQNTNPVSKCEAFKVALASMNADSLDIALMKMCYIDFREGTDMAKVFDSYTQTVDAIKKQYPGLTLIHVTVPLIAPERPAALIDKIKYRVKKVIGFPIQNDITNVMRNDFNKKVLEHYPQDPVFDIAMVESTYPDGTSSTFKWKGQEYRQLIWDYSDDGGHLTPIASKVAAKELLKVLSEVYKTRTKNSQGSSG